MDQVWLKNFRCFGERQSARLAPLTLLVGENSTGKTSFLALIRALWDAARIRASPNVKLDFKEAPYDLGSFDEIAHYRGGRAGRAEHIETGVVIRRKPGTAGEALSSRYRIDVRFGRKGTVPVPVRWRLAYDDVEGVWLEECLETVSVPSIRFGTANGEWRWQPPEGVSPVGASGNQPLGLYAMNLFDPPLYSYDDPVLPNEEHIVACSGSPPILSADLSRLNELAAGFTDSDVNSRWGLRPFAGAPVRSRPRRTYDPARPGHDPEGEGVPMYLSTVFFEDKESWKALKHALEEFGRGSGLFDEISVRPLGKRGSEPFQMHVRKRGLHAKGPMRNLIDVGYGISQVLPILTELFRDSETPMFLLQQPEVHLHPSAQAALGSLFCQVATRDRQLVIETHSDHLLDRVRMDVRDGTKLKPEDVSILFFERRDLDVRIHSLRLDGEGNVIGAPPSYRSFFMKETRRSLRL